MRLALSLVVGVATLVGAPTFKAAELAAPDQDPIEYEATAEERAVYGLPTDPAVFAKVHERPSSWLTDFGIPVTDDEAAQLDLTSRWEFETLVSAHIQPYLQARNEFGGMYFDQRRDGDLFVLLTEHPAETVDQILALAKEFAPRINFRQATHPYGALETGVAQLSQMWDTEQWGPRPVAIGIDVRNNAIRVYRGVEESTVVQDQRLADALALPVVTTRGARVAGLDTCTSRLQCYDPTKAGIKVSSGLLTPCTMGFHVTLNGDEQFLLAGHCSFGNLSNDWWHGGLFLGSVKATL